MKKDDWAVISVYTDQQAVEDGVLVAFPGAGGVNRVTRAVFDYFTSKIGSSSITGAVTDVTALQQAIQAMLRVPPDEVGWRTGVHRGIHGEKKLWLVPNEVRGLTFMFPEDY